MERRHIMAGIMKRCSASNPCPLCGSRDWDMAIDYGDEGTVYWCHKLQNAGNVIVGGKEYVCIAVNKEIDHGRFNLYKEKTEHDAIQERKRQEWIEEQRRTNPNWKDYGNFKPATEKKAETVILKKVEKKEKIETFNLSNKEKDERFRYFLSLLILEEKHKTLLIEEWSGPVYPDLAKVLLEKYPIKSLPPEDKYRFAGSNRQTLHNNSRKSIVMKMLEKFGDLRGLNGFYLRSDNGWKNKPEKERWTFAKGEGIIFPVFDEYGYLYDIRIRQDYPDIKASHNGEDGVYQHRYDSDGNHTWWFYSEKYPTGVLVYGPLRKDISLNEKGLPNGKATNKYKAFSSFKEKIEGDYIVNAMEGGSKPGAGYSLYVPDNCTNFSVVIGIEGEKKGMVTAYIKNVPCTTVAGVGTFRCLFRKIKYNMSFIEYLKRKGMKIFILCYDADKENNPQVAKAEKRFIEELQAAGIMVLIGKWSGKFEKGLDDVLILGCDFITEQPQ